MSRFAKLVALVVVLAAIAAVAWLLLRSGDPTAFARGKRVASRIDTGMVFINHPTWTAADLPFGGIKHSGYGRELSSLGIQEFVNKKLIRVADINAPA